MISYIEQTMYQLLDFIMAPVLLLISALFIYALFASGQFFAQPLKHRTNKTQFEQLLLSNLG
jgi:hypothetical protein